MTDYLFEPVRHVDQVEPPRNGFRQPKVAGKWMYSPSSYDAVSDKSSLIPWSQERAAEVFSTNSEASDALRMIGDLESPEGRKQLRALVKKAMEGSKATQGRDRGSLIHLGIEHVNRGGSLDDLTTPFVRQAAETYLRMLEKYGLIPRLAEIFLASEELGVAGTADAIMTSANSPSILVDYKSGRAGSEAWAAVSWATQCSLYVNSLPYCHEKGFLSWESCGVEPPRTDIAIVMHIPSDGAEAKLHTVDCVRGLELVALSRQVKDARKWKGLATTIGGL
jgi:hypothetical protein